MYRKSLIYIGVFASFLLSSCAKSQMPEKTIDVSFCAAVDAEATRGDEYVPNADSCIMEIYYNGNLYERQKKALSASKQTVFTATMIAERTYDIVFWADKDGAYNNSSLKEVSYKYPMKALNDLDAFYCRSLNQKISASSSLVTNIILRRPFALISINSATTKTSRVNAPQQFNLLTDEFSSYTDFEFNTDEFFVFTQALPKNISITIGETVCENVPICRNYKTNITID